MGVCSLRIQQDQLKNIPSAKENHHRQATDFLPSQTVPVAVHHFWFILSIAFA